MADDLGFIEDEDLGFVTDEELGFVEEAPETREISATCAFFQGATCLFGFGDEMAGASEAVGRALGLEGMGGPITEIELARDESGEAQGPTLSPEKLLEAYRSGRGARRKQMEETREQRPIATTAGQVTGELLATGAVGKMVQGGVKGSQALSKVLPSTAGAEKAARAGQLADKAKKLEQFQRVKKLKGLKDKINTGMMVREGAKAGALYGLGTSEADLTKGEFGDALYDTLIGGGVGAIAAGALSKGSQAVRDVALKIPGVANAIDSFKFGLQGKSLDSDIVNERIANTAGKYVKNLEKTLGKLGKEKRQVMKMMDDAGITINTKEDLDKARLLVENIDSPTLKKEAQQFLDIIGDYMQGGREARKAISTLEKEIAKSAVKDPAEEAVTRANKNITKKLIRKAAQGKDLPDVGEAQVLDDVFEGVSGVARKVGDATEVQTFTKPNYSKIQKSVDSTTGRNIFSIQDLNSGQVKAITTKATKELDAEKLTPMQAEKLKNLLKDYSAIAKEKNMPREVKQAATQAVESIKAKLDGASREVSENLNKINNEIHRYLNVSDKLKLEKYAVGDIPTANNVQKMANFIAGTSDKNPLSDKSIIIKQLRKINPKLADEILEEIDELRRMHQLSQPAEHVPESASIRSLIGTAQGVLNKAANAIGQHIAKPAAAARQVSRKLSDKSLDIIQASPQEIQVVLEKLKQAGGKSPYIPAIEKAMKSEQRSRQAILYGLYQQPAFRQLIETIEQEIRGEQENESNEE